MPPEPSRLPIFETPVPFEKALPEALLEELGRLSCLDLATEPSPPRSADGSFLSGSYSPYLSGFSAAGLSKAPLNCPLTRAPREQR